jgi:hypothetical protein
MRAQNLRQEQILRCKQINTLTLCDQLSRKKTVARRARNLLPGINKRHHILAVNASLTAP